MRTPPKEKIEVEPAVFLCFYNEVVDTLMPLVKSKGFKCKRDAVWLKEDAQKRPLVITILCEKLSLLSEDAQLRQAFCDPGNTFVNLNYMYTLKKQAEDGKVVWILKSRADFFARLLDSVSFTHFVKNLPIALSAEQQVRNRVELFYNSIAVKNFETAWNCLSPNFKALVWSANDNGDLSYEDNDRRRLTLFKGGYFFFRSLSALHVFHLVKLSDIQVECLVYYESELELPVVQELELILKTPISQVDEIVGHVKKFSKLVADHGGIDHEKREIARLFNPAAIEFFWFTSGVDAARLRKSYDVRTTQPPINYLLKCICVKIDENWYIDRLLPRRC